MRQNEIILVSQNGSFMDVGLHRKSFILFPKKAVCHFSRSLKIHKTDEISGIKKLTIQQFMPTKKGLSHNHVV